MMRFALPKTLPQATIAAGITFSSLRTVNRDLVTAINTAFAEAQNNGEKCKTWFGIDVDAHATVVAAMTKMHDFANGHAILTLVVKDTSEAGADSNAYAWPQGDRSVQGQYILNLGVGFGELEDNKVKLTNPDGNGQALQTIAHELCHLVFNANIPHACPDAYTEEKYREDALSLAKDKSGWAAWNAENYGYFIEACSPSRILDKSQSTQPQHQPKHDAKSDPDKLTTVSDIVPAGPEEEALKAYLQQVGLGEYATAFREHGVTSLKLLRMLDSDTGKDVKAKICKMIKTGWKEGDKVRPGSALAASHVETVTADDVQACIEKEHTTEVSGGKKANDADEAKAKAKQEQLRKAVDEVSNLREQWAKVASKENEDEKKNVADKLDKLIGQFRSENILSTFPSADDLAKDLSASFATAETALAHVSSLTTAAISKKALTAVDLIFGHQLLRGRYIDTNGMIEAPGGTVIALPKRSSDADLFGPGLETKDFSRSYQSESAMMRSERLIETHASSFAVAAEARGSAFLGSGIGAMSLSAEYSQAKEERNDSSQASSGRTATQIQTRYHWSPMRQIVFATNQFRLNSEALAEVRAILDRTTAARRPDVLEFMKTFGTHVFGRITLGGWYKYTAKATAKDETDRSSLESAVANAMDWAVSASATYTGIGAVGSATVGAAGSGITVSVSGREMRYTTKEHEVTISTTMLGGVDGLPREEWIGSVQYPSQWRVIQREAPVPIWTLIRGIEPASLGSDFGDDTALLLSVLADEFEEVWVQEVMARSLDVDIYRQVVESGITTVNELEKLLREKSRMLGHQLVWSRPDWIFNMFGSPTNPTAFIYRNALYLFGFRTWDDGKSRDTYEWSFDGTEWQIKEYLSRILYTPDNNKKMIDNKLIYNNGGDGGEKNCDAPFRRTLYWQHNKEPAVVTIKDNYLLICSPLDDKGYMDWMLYKSPYYIRELYSGNPALLTDHVVPALVQFKDNTYILHVSTKSSSIECFPVPFFWKGSVPGDSMIMPNDRAILKSSTRHRIAAAVFNGRLYCVHVKDGTDDRLCCMSSDDGKTWTDPVVLPGDGANEGPSLAVYSSPTGPRLYCAYPGKGADEPLYIISTSDGIVWSDPSPVGNVRTKYSPALAAFTDQQGVSKLYCFYKSLSEENAISFRVAAWE